MPRIELPISKSIANRLLILQAIHGDEFAGSPTALASWGALMPVSATMPEDVQILQRALTTLKTFRTSETLSTPHINVGNCGTAMRFLTAYAAQLENKVTVLDGVERMHHRPIGQLVDALREIGADIEYLGEEGFPPLRIKGCILDKDRIITLDNPQSTQFISALLLIGANVQTNSTSPYITLTREIIESYLQRVKRANYSEQSERTTAQRSTVSIANELEKDWSSAAFWYEYVALHGGEITLPGLFRDSLQGDKVVADIFAHLGVHTTYTDEGITIKKDNEFLIQQPKQLNPTTLRGNHLPAAPGAKANNPCRSREFLSRLTAQTIALRTIRAEVVDIVVDNTLSLDFANCPDLYPAVALTCERLGIELHATGTESLSIKESDRLRAVREHRTDHDHRMAMALLIAGYEVDDTACISKSYPQFLEQFRQLQYS